MYQANPVDHPKTSSLRGGAEMTSDEDKRTIYKSSLELRKHPTLPQWQMYGAFRFPNGENDDVSRWDLKGPK